MHKKQRAANILGCMRNNNAALLLDDRQHLALTSEQAARALVNTAVMARPSWDASETGEPNWGLDTGPQRAGAKCGCNLPQQARRSSS